MIKRFENKCECGKNKVAGAIACGTCYAEADARRNRAAFGSITITELAETSVPWGLNRSPIGPKG